MSNKTYNLVGVSEKTLKTIKTACELLARVQLGQIDRAIELLPLKEDYDNEKYWELLDIIHSRLPELTIENIDGYRSSLGIGHSKVSDMSSIAWDVCEVVRYKLAWQFAIDQRWVESEDSSKTDKMYGVEYYTPMGWGSEPLIKIEANNGKN